MLEDVNSFFYSHFQSQLLPTASVSRKLDIHKEPLVLDSVHLRCLGASQACGLTVVLLFVAINTINL